MPIFIEISNLVIRKSTVEEKYAGGLQKFRKDFRIKDTKTRHDEDNLLFSVAYMGVNTIDICELTNYGFDYDEEKEFSDDFVIIDRYQGPLWKCDWFDNNAVFFWHKNDKAELIKKAQEINKLSMDKINEMFDNGVEVFKTLKD